MTSAINDYIAANDFSRFDPLFHATLKDRYMEADDQAKAEICGWFAGNAPHIARLNAHTPPQTDIIFQTQQFEAIAHNNPKANGNLSALKGNAFPWLSINIDNPFNISEPAQFAQYANSLQGAAALVIHMGRKTLLREYLDNAYKQPLQSLLSHAKHLDLNDSYDLVESLRMVRLANADIIESLRLTDDGHAVDNEVMQLCQIDLPKLQHFNWRIDDSNTSLIQPFLDKIRSDAYPNLVEYGVDFGRADYNQLAEDARLEAVANRNRSTGSAGGRPEHPSHHMTPERLAKQGLGDNRDTGPSLI